MVSTKIGRLWGFMVDGGILDLMQVSHVDGYMIFLLRSGIMLLLCVDIHNENRSYTDMHDVDENALSISRGGGWLSHGSFAGVAHRDMYHSPSYVSDYVASSNVQNIELYGSA